MPEEKKRGRGRPHEIFQPIKPAVARLLAHKAAEIFQRTTHVIGLGESRCQLCKHPNREEIDYLILINAPLRHRQAAFGEGGENLNYTRSRNHRDWHLVPLIMTEVTPAIASLKMVPFPIEGSLLDQERWFFEQSYGLYLDALDKGNGTRALSALERMREFSRSIREMEVEFARPVERTVEHLPPPNSAPPLRVAKDPEKVRRAFQLSTIRRKAIADEKDAQTG